MSTPDQDRWRVGECAPERRVGPITRTHIVRYAGAGGDFNPIHHDDEFARAAGYPGVFAHGMLTAGILGGYVADWLGHEQLRSFQVRYVAQVWPGDELSLHGEVTAALATLDGLQVECQLAVYRLSGSQAPQLVLSGTARALMPGIQ